jgi:hypothetical protein
VETYKKGSIIASQVMGQILLFKRIFIAEAVNGLQGLSQ